MFTVSLSVLFTLVCAVILLEYAVFLAFSKRNRIVTRSFWCPERKQAVTAEFQEDHWTGRRAKVNYCTAFSPATSIRCDKSCLRQ